MAGRAEDAVRATRSVCRSLGLPADDLSVIRSSSYVVIRIGGTPYVARVGGTGARVATHAREMALARVLSGAGVPVALPAPFGEPLVVDGPSAVGLWLWVDERPGAPSPADLGAVLRCLHDAASGIDLAPLDLPPFRAPARALHRLARLVGLGQLDEGTAAALGDAVEALVPPGNGHRQLVHGDFRTANVLLTETGPVVIDFDAACYGPPEWDLTLVAQQHRHFGLPAAALEAFVEAYGGVAEPHEFEALCRLRDIASAAWALSMAAGLPTFRDEADRRVASALDPSDRSRWSWDGLPSARAVR